MKVCVNRMHGGFGLSDKAIRRYGEIAGLTFYPEIDNHSFTTWWTKPENDRGFILDDGLWHTATEEEKTLSNKNYDAAHLCPRDIKRDDPALVQVVEELGEEANGRFAALQIVEIPDDVEWQIEEYDGLEWVAEKHRTWS